MSRTIVPAKYQHTNFVFPTNLKVGMKFRSIQEIDTFLRKEAQMEGAPLDKMINDKDYHPSLSKWTCLRYRCKRCRIAIRFSKREEWLIVSKVNNHHQHENMPNPKPRLRVKAEKLENPSKLAIDQLDPQQPYQPNQQRQVPAPRNRPQNKKRQEEESEPIKVVKVENIELPTEESAEKPADEQEIYVQSASGQKSDILVLMEWFKNRDFHVRIDNDSARHKSFNLLVAASPRMINSYTLYGDVLHIELFDSKEEESKSNMVLSYNIAVFTVMDTNMRPLLAGIAMFKERSTKAVGQIIRAFFTIHKIPPKTIVTASSSYIQSVLERMTSRGEFTGAHQIYPSHLMASLCDKLRGTTGEIACGVGTIKQAMKCRNQEIFKDMLLVMSRIRSTTGKSMAALIEEEEATSGLFYPQQIKPTFVGLGLLEPREIIELVHQLHHKLHLSVMEFVEGMDAIDAEFKTISVSTLQLYPEDIGPLFHNYRLSEIGQDFEEKVVERFIENYVTGMSNCSIVDWDQSETSVALIRTGNEPKVSEIKEWSCSCKELERTGVACPHLIMLATSATNKQYGDLIHPRWRKRLSWKAYPLEQV